MKSKEEILAKKLDDLLADSRIEPYLIGRYFAQSATVDVYDNFEEMVESARDEKQNRIEWIKDIIIGEKDMTTTFEDKCRLLADFELCYSEDSRFTMFIDYHCIAFPLSFCVENNLIDISGITEEGKQHIIDAFDELLAKLGVEDTTFYSLPEIEDIAGLTPQADW